MIHERIGDGILPSSRTQRGVNDAIDSYYINFSCYPDNRWSYFISHVGYSGPFIHDWKDNSWWTVSPLSYFPFLLFLRAFWYCRFMYHRSPVHHFSSFKRYHQIIQKPGPIPAQSFWSHGGPWRQKQHWATSRNNCYLLKYTGLFHHRMAAMGRSRSKL